MLNALGKIANKFIYFYSGLSK